MTACSIKISRPERHIKIDFREMANQHNNFAMDREHGMSNTITVIGIYCQMGERCDLDRDHEQIRQVHRSRVQGLQRRKRGRNLPEFLT